jgi:hypothetical protein
MTALLGFEIDFWDYVTFASLFIITLSVILLAILILGLPGKLAIARKHPDAEAVNLMGWLGFIAIVPWVQALIWSLKPTSVVDIRRFPKEEEKATDATIMRLSGKTVQEETKDPKDGKPAHGGRGGGEEGL